MQVSDRYYIFEDDTDNLPISQRRETRCSPHDIIRILKLDAAAVVAAADFLLTLIFKWV